ncbi:TPA: hypothetical protein R4193_004773 [Serratia marcescens]|uniref:hypothetical protein n=1 Tax=Serratia marcescens TaxID=615 RepID=UPI001495AC1F|nr:hypothetical protein [Serratia marcescens]EGT0505745.1 hypothetical protein [Serratia marcescens]EHT9831646.1 hypothetical protein [Serratia marcescens]EIU0972827.1 hypothetical protein [Serratia marcescens]EMB7756083.1 hypothetical protein [Serratia marcescens]MDP8749565.1 hypothetical protein [Serratia marcescens]
MNIQTVGIKLLVYLVFFCFLLFVGMALGTRLVIALIFYYQHDTFIFGWENDVVYSVKAGLAADIPAGVGVWLMSWMKARKEKHPLPKE